MGIFQQSLCACLPEGRNHENNLGMRNFRQGAMVRSTGENFAFIIQRSFLRFERKRWYIGSIVHHPIGRKNATYITYIPDILPSFGGYIIPTTYYQNQNSLSGKLRDHEKHSGSWKMGAPESFARDPTTRSLVDSLTMGQTATERSVLG